jgi:hypothetical protein
MVADYLHAFFKEPEKLTQRKRFWTSHAIAHDDGAHCALISAGDVRVKVYFENFGSDPTKAASDVYAKFKAMTEGEMQKAIEEVHQ